jgi:hypothetical protein
MHTDRMDKSFGKLSSQFYLFDPCKFRVAKLRVIRAHVLVLLLLVADCRVPTASIYP